MFCDVEVDHSPAVMRQYHKHKKHSKRGRRYGEEVYRDQLAEVVVEERCASSVKAACAAAASTAILFFLKCQYRASGNSPWILGAPHIGLASAICLISDLTLALTAGRPPRLCCEIRVQKSLNPLRCQLITVSGLTISSDSRQPPQIHDSQIQKRRSLGRSGGRGMETFVDN